MCDCKRDFCLVVVVDSFIFICNRLVVDSLLTRGFVSSSGQWANSYIYINSYFHFFALPVDAMPSELRGKCETECQNIYRNVIIAEISIYLNSIVVTSKLKEISTK